MQNDTENTRILPEGIRATDYTRNPYEVYDEPTFCEWLYKKYSLFRYGYGYCIGDGPEIDRQDVVGIIQAEIKEYIKRDLGKKAYSLERVLLGICPKKTKPLETYSLESLEDENIEPPPYVIDRLLPVGLTINAAPPKYGKSWLAYGACDAIAAGGDFLGRQAAKGRCLYLDLEGNKARTKQRFFDKMGGEGHGNVEMCYNADMIEDGLLDQLSGYVERHPDTLLIVIDTYARVKGKPGRNLNAYENDTRLLSPLQRFALDHKLAILLITHFSKPKGYKPDDNFERIVGSGGQLGVADAAWVLYGEREEQEKELQVTGRDIEDERLTIEFDKNTCRWKLIGDAETITQQREYDKYTKDSLVKTLNYLIDNNGGIWRGTAESLLDEIEAHTHDVSIKSGQAISSKIKSMEFKLRLYDSIVHSPPNNNGGRQGRIHSFMKVNK